MSLVALGQLARDLDRVPGTKESFVADPVSFLAAYDLTETEREAVLDLDAERLVGLGLNPMVMWNILGAAGIAWPDLYTHARTLRHPTRKA
ncbi:hypothetical protein [Nocardioides sp. KR10-350]|uniref:hypothetical protein n=1 Tax=Nocardioides cheoyonin TaxID=3156615 RepID=UPI0032B4797C